MHSLIDEKSLETIRQYMLLNKETIAMAESVTAGLLQWGFSSVPDAAQFFNGGVTAYNLQQKLKHLAVDPDHAIEVNCVSQKIANEMAINVCTLFNSNWGIGVTGYASPVPESHHQLFAYYAIAYNGKCKVMNKLTSNDRDPKDVQFEYAAEVMKSFVKLL
ncbi:MAG: CinA family protein [Agriterribacter sp.]